MTELVISMKRRKVLEGTNYDVKELNTEVAFGEGTVLHVTTLRSETTGGENLVSSVGGTFGDASV